MSASTKFQSNEHEYPSIVIHLTVLSETAALKCFAGGDASFLYHGFPD